MPRPGQSDSHDGRQGRVAGHVDSVGLRLADLVLLRIIFHVTAEIVANIPAITVSLIVAFLAAQSQGKMARSLMGYLAVTVITILATFAGSFHEPALGAGDRGRRSSIIIYLPQLALVIRPRTSAASRSSVGASPP